MPDGRKFLYYVFARQREYPGIYSGSLNSDERRQVLSANSNVAYAPPGKGEAGYLLFVRGTTLVAQPFDAERLQLSGEPLPVAEQLGYYEGFRIGDFSVSQNGALAYGSGIVYPMAQLIWFDHEGKQLGSVGTAGHYTTPRFSPDQHRFAVGRMDPRTAAKVIWLVEVTNGQSSRFTFDPSSADFPVWSPDGSRIVFATARDGPFNLYQKNVNGGTEEPILKSDDFKLPTDWSPDGRFVLFHSMSVRTTNPNWDLWILPLNGDSKPYPLTQTPFNENFGRFSPDGRWIAYASDESGRYEIYVESFARESSEARRKWQISTNGGVAPKWRHDGKELFYAGLDRKLMAVKVKTSSTTVLAGIPEALFEPPGDFDVAADGKRCLVTIKVAEELPSPITVVLNWTASLRR